MREDKGASSESEEYEEDESSDDVEALEREPCGRWVGLDADCGVCKRTKSETMKNEPAEYFVTTDARLAAASDPSADVETLARA
jgi:hypothetical protein